MSVLRTLSDDCLREPAVSKVSLVGLGLGLDARMKVVVSLTLSLNLVDSP
jgi:hypothetical protein